MSQPQSPNSSIASTNDQSRFFSQRSHRIYFNNDDKNITIELHQKKQRRRRCIKCCGCCIATILLLVVIMLVLGFTVFRVHEPSIRMNSVKIDGINYLNTSTTLQPNVNLTVSVDLSVKNRNSMSFKFNEATTSLFYDDVAIGEALTPPGTTKARRTLRMNVTVEIMVEKILRIPRLGSDLKSGELPVSTYTIINGRINMLNIIKKNIEVEMNCNMMVDLRNQYVRDIDCKKNVSL
uniref:Plant cell wall protein SlTFR88 n=2 Tax=Solanum TaxID=4107 RepID=M1DFQ6_SOLTU